MKKTKHRNQCSIEKLNKTNGVNSKTICFRKVINLHYEISGKLVINVVATSFYSIIHQVINRSLLEL